jgi:3-oxoadipate enol-lactonase
LQFAHLNGVTIHYQVIGAAGKPLIVFANALGTDFRIWRDVIVRLVGDYAVLCYDMRGHGLSGTGSVPHSIEQHANDLAALMDHLQTGPCARSAGSRSAAWSRRCCGPSAPISWRA